ncbi:hypothetical protein [Haloplanus aerogenes]|uniref:Glutamate/valine-rich protein n=1 Tax=Haloplanus aerogenes TaxID=660522 RepID=A0A3M0DTS0_9EURY|nr:hypothetical protein [Haloplanus aerogenes]AZH25687.1 hypothetical protein DU502_09985 [Haloplanus aerogenes]RMB25419.1 hypothetical protein ATH50_0509 [Haloplanus aerogenes]
MNPNRVDFFVDLAYGVVILLSVALILLVGTGVGVAFGIGTLVSYAIHVVWKMARFDPEWMSREVTEKVEETLTEEVTEEVTESVEQTVTEEVTEEVTEKVEQTVTEEVTENVERTISDEMNDIIEQLEQVNQRVDRRPRTDEIDDMQRELTTEDDDTDEAKR